MPSNIKSAIKHIKAEWKQGESLKEVARLFSVDPGNLARAFKETHGTTVKEYVDRKRVEYVKAAAVTDSQYGYQIGAALGFASDLAFYRWVARAFGRSWMRLKKNTRKSE